MATQLRGWIWKWIRRALFRFEPELAHQIGVKTIRVGASLGGWTLRAMSGAKKGGAAPHEAFGMRFRSRLGLAAGFDKNAEILEGLADLGFGFVEIGTVTPRPQPGNERPRLFRFPAEERLFNRMGFNNLGATVISRRLAEARPRLAAEFRVGVNLGKNKDTPNEEAARDYAQAAAAFEGLADYLVVNVSSPNTPGLRALQSVEALERITGEVRAVIDRWSSVPPLLLKLAPEVQGEELIQLLGAEKRLGIGGWVLTNTLAGMHQGSPGGWSGPIVAESSIRALREAKRSGTLPVISVGGIRSPQDAVARLREGAELIQIYTGWVYGGPTLPARISAEIRP